MGFQERLCASLFDLSRTGLQGGVLGVWLDENYSHEPVGTVNYKAIILFPLFLGAAVRSLCFCLRLCFLIVVVCGWVFVLGC